MSTMEVPHPDDAVVDVRYKLKQMLDGLNEHTVSIHARDDATAIEIAEGYKSKRWLVENGKYELSRDNITIHAIHVGAYSDD